MKARSTDAQFAANALNRNTVSNRDRSVGRLVYLEAVQNSYHQRHQKRQEQERLERRDLDSKRRAKIVPASAVTA